MSLIEESSEDPWNPWAALRARPDIELHFDPVAAILGGGLYARAGDLRLIVLDPALGRRHRRAALAHELVHDEWGTGCDGPDIPPTWDDVVTRTEAAIDDEVARRLVPRAQLEALARRRASIGEPTTAADIAEAFDVDESVATRAAQRAWRGDVIRI